MAVQTVPFDRAAVPVALLVARLGLGVIFFYHGMGKLLGWFGGPGLATIIEHMGPVQGVLVSIGEGLGGLAVLVGLLSRFSAWIHVLIMLGAIVMVHGKNGFSSANGGFEFNYALIALALVVAIAGPGRYAVGALLPTKLKPWLE